MANVFVATGWATGWRLAVFDPVRLNVERRSTNRADYLNVLIRMGMLTLGRAEPLTACVAGNQTGRTHQGFAAVRAFDLLGRDRRSLAAFSRAVFVFGALWYKIIAALSACLSLFVTLSEMGQLATARTAVHGFPGGLGSACSTVLGVGGRGTQLLSMYRLMARNAHSQAIVDIGAFVFVVCKRFDVVGVKAACCAAQSAGVIVALVNRFAPLHQVIREPGAFAANRFATLPCGGFFANIDAPTSFAGAFKRACGLIGVVGLERLPANFTGFVEWWVALRPALLRAVRASLVGFDLEGFATAQAFACFAIATVLASHLVKTGLRTKTLGLIEWVIDRPADLAGCGIVAAW